MTAQARGELLRLPTSPAGGPAGGRRVTTIIVVGTALAAALRLYQLARPGYLLGVSEYDDGVNFGNALRLVTGVIPYRDFVSVQPPGASLLMSPVALLARVIGTSNGLAAARVLTAVADAGSAALLGLLVRHRGPLAVAVATGVYAVLPDALIASRTFMLEPWLNLCFLAGLLLVFKHGQVADGRRLVYGGAVLGFAVTVKIWAAVPLVLLCLFMIGKPRRLAALTGGVAAGLGLTLLPFLILAPGAFVQDVITSQLVRSSLHHQAPWSRLLDLAGVTLVPAWLLATIGGVLAASAVVLVVTWPRVLGPHVATLDRYAAAGLLAVVAMVLWPAAYFSHYGAVAGPFLALALVWPAMRLSRAWSGVGAVRDPRLRSGIAALFAAATIGATGVSDFAAVTSLWTPVSPAASADQLIPPGACVFTNSAALTITADRFFSDGPGCPVMVDSFGTLLALTGGHSGTAPPAELAAVTARLRSALARARYVWIAPAMIDWTRDLRGYFDQRFRLIGLATGVSTPYAPAPGLYIAR